MSQSEKSFTVSDRRHFTVEGRPREDAEEPEAGAEPAAEPAPASEGRAAAPEANEPPADFGRFVMGLAAECGRLLAGEGLPEGTPRGEALAGARSIVSILEMLKARTEGNRTKDEDALLAELLFQLRMAYIERARTEQP